MSVIVVDDDIVQVRRFRSMQGTDCYWNCDSDHGLHVEGYCPNIDEDFASYPHPLAYYDNDAND